MTAPDYLQHAYKDIGLREIKGQSHAARILQAFEIIGHKWLKTDEDAWCAAILGLWMKEAGQTFPKNAFRALSWATWGEPCGVELGAVAVMTRKGGGHVGLVDAVSHDRKFVRVLGGNQNNMVCDAWFPAERITHYRKPTGMTLQPAPVMAKGTLSKSEA